MVNKTSLKGAARSRFTSVHTVLALWAVFIVAIAAYNLYAHNAAGTSALGQVFGQSEDEPTPVACVPFEPIPGDKTVILRIDDVQAWAWASTTRLMIDDAAARRIPLALGIIPIQFTEDVALVEFLQARACNLEFALHGFDHQSVGPNQSIPEFGELDSAAARQRLQDGLAVLSVITDQPIVTWIPPLNIHSTGTQEVLNELGLTRWSTEGEAHWDYDSSTFSYDTHTLIPTDETIAGCVETFETSDVCIIMLHPQDFTTNDWHDAEKYDQYYLDLLDRLYGMGYSFGTFESVANKT